MRRQIASLAIGKVASSVLQFCIITVIARHASISDFGMLLIGANLSQLIGVFLDLGISTKIFAKKRSAALDRLVCTSVVVRFAVACLFVVVLIASTEIGHRELRFALLAAILNLLESLADTQTFLHQSSSRESLGSLLLVCRRLTILGLVIAGSRLESLDAALVTACVVCLCFSLPLVGQFRHGVLSLKRAFATSKRFVLLSFGANLAQLDLPVVGLVLGAAAAGMYGPSTRLLGPISIVSNSVVQALQMKIRRTSPRSAEGMQTYRVANRWYSIGAISIAATSFVWPEVTTFIFGNKYQSSAWISIAVGIVAASIVFAQFQLAWFTSTRIPKYINTYFLVSPPIGLTILAIGSHYFGLLGSALALAGYHVFTSLGLLRLRIVDQRRISSNTETKSLTKS